MIQITMMAVTLYLHRDQAHRSIDLHPLLRHFFRFWIWCTSGMLTREWVAVHRKHHAFCETKDDPHSPQIYGIRKVLLEGAELYRVAIRKQDIIDKYGHGAPDDWLERNVYAAHSDKGYLLLAPIAAAYCNCGPATPPTRGDRPLRQSTGSPRPRPRKFFPGARPAKSSSARPPCQFMTLAPAMWIRPST